MATADSSQESSSEGAKKQTAAEQQQQLQQQKQQKPGLDDENGDDAEDSDGYDEQDEEDDGEDEEDTLAEEEALAAGDDGSGEDDDELAGLEAEADMPLEELMARYGGYSAATTAAVAASEKVLEGEVEVNDDNDEEEDDPEYVPTPAAAVWLPKEPRLGEDFQAVVPPDVLPPSASAADCEEVAGEASEESAALLLSDAEVDALECGLRLHGKRFGAIRECHLPEKRLGDIVHGYYRWKATPRGREFLDRLRAEKAAKEAVAVAAVHAANSLLASDSHHSQVQVHGDRVVDSPPCRVTSTTAELSGGESLV